MAQQMTLNVKVTKRAEKEGEKKLTKNDVQFSLSASKVNKFRSDASTKTVRPIH